MLACCLKLKARAHLEMEQVWLGSLELNDDCGPQIHQIVPVFTAKV